MSDKKMTERTSELPKKRVVKKKAVARATMPVRERVYTFAQWARRRGVKQHHRGGLRAYVSNVEQSRSLEEWDAHYKGY